MPSLHHCDAADGTTFPVLPPVLGFAAPLAKTHHQKTTRTHERDCWGLALRKRLPHPRVTQILALDGHDEAPIRLVSL